MYESKKSLRARVERLRDDHCELQESHAEDIKRAREEARVRGVDTGRREVLLLVAEAYDLEENYQAEYDFSDGTFLDYDALLADLRRIRIQRERNDEVNRYLDAMGNLKIPRQGLSAL